MDAVDTDYLSIQVFLGLVATFFTGGLLFKFAPPVVGVYVGVPMAIVGVFGAFAVGFFARDSLSAWIWRHRRKNTHEMIEDLQ